jgi:hypothetical protein
VTEDEYTARIARVINRAMQPTLDELIDSGADLDARVVLDGQPDWESVPVPEDLAPGE